MKDIKNFEIFWVGAFCGVRNIATGRIILNPIFDHIQVAKGYFKVKLSGMVGITKFNGKYLIKPFFDEIEDFIDGYAIVAKRRRYGLVNLIGDVIINPIYDSISTPSEGIVRFSIYDGNDFKYGFFDIDKKKVISKSLAFATDFKNGLAGVAYRLIRTEWEDNVYSEVCYINRDGNKVFEVNEGLNVIYDKLHEFDTKLCRVDFYQDQLRCGFINKLGQVEIPFIYEDFLTPYKRIIPAKRDGKWGIINYKGFTVFNFHLDEIGTLHINPHDEWCYNLKLNFPVKKMGEWGFMDFKGNIVLPFKYDDFLPNGFILQKFYIVKYSGEWGVINEFEDQIIPFKYTEIREWNDEVSLFAVCKGRKWGFINIHGQEIIPIAFERVGYFNNGLVMVESHGKRGWYDAKGRVIIQIKYKNYEYDFFDKYTDFEYLDVVIVTLRKKACIIDRDGNLLVKPLYDKLLLSENVCLAEINKQFIYFDFPESKIKSNLFDNAREFREGMAAVSLNSNWGFIDHSLKVVISCNFKEVNDFKNGYAAVNCNGQWGFIDKRGKQIIQCKYDKVYDFKEGSAKCDDYYVDSNGVEMNIPY